MQSNLLRHFVRSMSKRVNASQTIQIFKFPNHIMLTQPRSFSSNFKSLDEDNDQPQESKYVKFDPNAPEPEIDAEEYKRMQNSLAKFS